MNGDLQIFVDIDEFIELPQCIRDIDIYIDVASSSNANGPESAKTQETAYSASSLSLMPSIDSDSDHFVRNFVLRNCVHDIYEYVS